MTINDFISTISVYQGTKTDGKTYGVGLTASKAGCCGYGKMCKLFIVATNKSDNNINVNIVI